MITKKHVFKFDASVRDSYINIIIYIIPHGRDFV